MGNGRVAKSLLEQLPEIVARGRQQAEKILESLEGRHRVGLQTREWVLPSRDTRDTDWIAAANRQAHLDAEGEGGWTNRLIYGDNLLAMAALLAGDEHTPSLRGKVDLIYIDPPFDSKADYRTKVSLPGAELEQKPTVIEQFAYSDTWSDGTASYLAMIVPRLILMRELLSDTGSIYVHLDWHVGHYVKVVMDDIFGKDNFKNQIIWKRTSGHSDAQKFGNSHDTIFFYSKTDNSDWYQPYQEYDPVTSKTTTATKMKMAGNGCQGTLAQRACKAVATTMSGAGYTAFGVCPSQRCSGLTKRERSTTPKTGFRESSAIWTNPKACRVRTFGPTLNPYAHGI